MNITGLKIPTGVGSFPEQRLVIEPTNLAEMVCIWLLKGFETLNSFFNLTRTPNSEILLYNFIKRVDKMETEMSKFPSVVLTDNTLIQLFS